MAIYNSIKYTDAEHLKNLSIDGDVDLNFQIEVEEGTFYSPLMVASVIGFVPVLEILLTNPGIDLNYKDDETGCNSFWLASRYGNGAAMHFLASRGIDILNKHNETNKNALHIAI